MQQMNTPVWLRDKKCPRRNAYLAGQRIAPPGLTGTESLAEVVDRTMLAYNGARLREGCDLLVKKILEPDVTVGLTLAGALTPAGLGRSCVVPLIRAGFVDWIVATGANLYHDLHFAFDCSLHVGTPNVNDADLRDNGVVRIYDVLLDYTDCLLRTDLMLENILKQPEFREEMGMASFHHYLGKYAAEQEEANGLRDVSILAAAYRADVPVYTSSPGDSTIGMVSAKLALLGHRFCVNPFYDVNETASFVLAAKRSGGKSAVLLMGGGSPKNFMLQTEPQLQESFRVLEVGHDYFLQVTDARPDTGGLSGATPQEAVSWGKVDPTALPMPWCAMRTRRSSCRCFPITRCLVTGRGNKDACTSTGRRRCGYCERNRLPTLGMAKQRKGNQSFICQPKRRSLSQRHSCVASSRQKQGRRRDMLVLTRKSGERIVIGGDIQVTVLRVQGNRVKLGLTGPSVVPIQRGELHTRSSGVDTAKQEEPEGVSQ